MRATINKHHPPIVSVPASPAPAVLSALLVNARLASFGCDSGTHIQGPLVSRLIKVILQ